MSSVAASEAFEGPVLSLISKRLRALQKKLNRILQMEDSVAKGKTLNKEQEETLKTKPSVLGAIEELKKIKEPLSSALQEELQAKKPNLDDTQMTEMEKNELDAKKSNLDDTQMRETEKDLGGEKKLNLDDPQMSGKGEEEGAGEKGGNGVLLDDVVEDLLKLLYFGSMFDVSVKSQNDFVATMYRKVHERGCCLTYDYVTDDDASGDLLGEKDLDLISMLGELVISRPVDSSLSHKDALQRCIEHAKLWIANSEQPLAADSNVTYAALRGKLNKIMASDYFTTTPELKASVEMVAAAENYQSFHVPVNGPVAANVPVEVEDPTAQHDHKEQGFENSHEHEVYVDQSSFKDQVRQDASVVENLTEFAVENSSDVQHREDQTQVYGESKEQQNGTQRYHNYRPGRGGGRRRNPNGYGGRGGGRGGYENGHGQAGNYISRNNYNYRGRGGRGVTGGNYNQGPTQDVQ